MQNERIYCAPSLLEVCKQLLIYRSTGVLTIWRAPDSHQEAARITIGQGRPLSIFWGSHREHANDTLLEWLNSWGEIHFTFLASEVHLSLPALASPSHHTQPAPSTFTTPSNPHMQPAITRRLPAITQPLQATPAMPPLHASSGQKGQQPESTSHGTQRLVSDRQQPYDIHPQEELTNETVQYAHPTAIKPETLIATLTSNGRSFSAANLPRYDRTIFLLINGRRSIVDLSQLTKRSLEEVYSTLQRLRNMLLITIERQLTKKER